MSKGYFTIAQGENYQRMAYALALSLKVTQPEEFSKLSIGVTQEEMRVIPQKYLEVFDNVIEIPWSDAAIGKRWKLENEWKAIYMTPYDETVKLDADMIFPSDVSGWWKSFAESEGGFVTKPRTYRNEIITSDVCRKVFTENDLPNIYTAFFYFKKTAINFELFQLAEVIFKNWEKFFYDFFEVQHRPKFVSTDVVFALAAKILDYQTLCNFPLIDLPTFVHMKPELQNWGNYKMPEERWTQGIINYFNADCELIIENYRQTLPFHYYEKDFMTDKIISTLEKRLGI